MKQLRIVLWSLVVVAAIGAGALFGVRYLGPDVARTLSPVPAIGGAFELTTVTGETFTEKDLPGKATAMFFGFTHCPDVCPTTLYEASGWLKTLGADADRLRIVFVTVDPERDDPEQLAAYISAFDERIIGLTGSTAAIEEIKKAYRVFSRKVPLEGGDYTVDHTASVYLLDDQGSFAGTIAYQEATDSALAKLRRLVGAEAGTT